MNTLEMEMLEQGYQPGAPAFAGSIDGPVATETPCECGGEMEYKPFMKPRAERGDDNYRAFAVCTECGERVEF